MDIFFTVFDDLYFVFVAIVIIIMLSLLFNLTSNYSIGYRIFTNNNHACQIRDQEEVADQVSDIESVFIDNETRFDNLTKTIISTVVEYKTTYFEC